MLPEYENPVLHAYLKETTRYKPLTRQEEIDLSERIKKGDSIALRKLIACNLRFVVNVARTYIGQGMTFMDLIAEGNMGLIRAAKRFDGDKNFKFISYAVWWIRQAILAALSEQSRMCSVPLNRINLYIQIEKETERFFTENHRYPNDEELARALGVEADLIQSMLFVGKRPMSLDSPIKDNDSTYHEIISEDVENSEDLLHRKQLANALMPALGSLEPRDRLIIKLYFGIDNEFPMTLHEIGGRLGMTRERIRQIKERALNRMKLQSKKILDRIIL